MKKKPEYEKIRVEMICNFCEKGVKCKICGGTGKKVDYHYIFVDPNKRIAIDGDTLK